MSSSAKLTSSARLLLLFLGTKSSAEAVMTSLWQGEGGDERRQWRGGGGCVT
jgi:hypothetical protein